MSRKKKYRPSNQPASSKASASPVESQDQGEHIRTPPPDSLLPNNRQALFLLLLFLAAGLIIRVLNLSELSLWMDEYVHVMRAKHFIEDGGPLLTDDNNGILLTLSLLPGFALFDSSVFWARFPSVLFGLGLIYVVYRLGAQMFNRYVGLFAAGGTTFSLYLIFWSRVCRNYAPLAVFYALLGLLFLRAFEVQPDPKATDRWGRLGLSRRHLLLFPVVAVLAFLSHQLTFFMVFTLAVYSLLRLAWSFWETEWPLGRRKFVWLCALTLPFLLVVFVPPLGEALKKALSPFLLSNIADWAIPNWKRLSGLTNAKPWDAFNMYHSLVRYDLNWLYLPALAGFVAAFWLRPRAGLWLLCSVAVPFLLLSFVFREPSLRRYLIFIYPYLFIAAGVFFYALWNWLHTRVWPAMPRLGKQLLLALPILLLFFNAHWTGIMDMALARKLEGHIVDDRVANWSFTNWKEACEYVDKQRQPGDLLMATVPTAVSYYLEHEQVLWFRQSYYDTREKKYKFHQPNPTGGPSAASVEDLVRTVQSTPRGWLLADYYLDNIFTDERALLWMYQNMHYYEEASSDGSVMVFGWDNSKPKPERQNLVVELGRDDDKIESKEYHMNLPQSLFSQNQIELTVRTRWVDTNREALVLFNGQNAVWLPPNRGGGIEEAVLPLQREWLKPGTNTIRVLYETKRPSDPRKGFTLYFLSIAGK
ncbi:MAG: glycosyltransferase family 39 protein [Lewinellaceae bacterium]|nr:glycosyltransferase family 39 protein [Lewinellaceae bacterium]